MEDLDQLSRLTGCYGNQQCLTIIHDYVYSAHIFLKDRLLWFEAVIVKRLYLRHYCWDLNMFYTK